MFEQMTYKELTIELLLIGFLTVGECIKKRLEFLTKLNIYDYGKN